MNLPDKKYQIIYADPPWSYNDKSKSHGGGAEDHYPCMTIEDICGIPVDKISDDNSVLFMWTTYPMLEDSFKVINAWGFTYKTGAFTWVKTYRNGSLFHGMGRYTRANAEICLLAKKGHGVSRVNCGIPNTVIHEVGKHSQKPVIFREHIEDLFGDVSRIELFARRKPEGLFPMCSGEWDVWGNEV